MLAADVVVTMGCGDACPIYPGVRYIDWEVDDPAEASLDSVRAIRETVTAPRATRNHYHEPV